MNYCNRTGTKLVTLRHEILYFYLKILEDKSKMKFAVNCLATQQLQKDL